MESITELKLDGSKEGEAGNQPNSTTLASLQLQSSLPGDTASPFATGNGTSLPSSSHYEGTTFLQAAVGSNSAGQVRFIHTSLVLVLKILSLFSFLAQVLVEFYQSLNGFTKMLLI